MSDVSLSMGSMLDDNSFHEVIVSREKQDVILSVDGVRVRDKIPGDFQRLNLDGKMYIGGVPIIDQVVFLTITKSSALNLNCLFTFAGNCSL